MNLSDVQASQIAAVTAGYNAARYAGTVSVGGMTFPTDPATQQNIMGYLVAFLAPATPPAAMPLQDASGVSQSLTYAQLQALAEAIANASIAAWNKLESLTGNIKGAATAEAVQKIQW